MRLIPSASASLIILFTFTVEKFLKVRCRDLNVTSIIDSEDIYLKMRRKFMFYGYPKEDTFQHKQKVCTLVLGNDLFYAENINVVNPNHEVVRKLVEQNFTAIYGTYFRQKRVKGGTRPYFVNPYRLRDITVGKRAVSEYVFTCLTMKGNRESQRIVEYFISEKYDSYRFVFTDNDKGETIPIAAAEVSYYG